MATDPAFPPSTHDDTCLCLSFRYRSLSRTMPEFLMDRGPAGKAVIHIDGRHNRIIGVGRVLNTPTRSLDHHPE